MYQSIAIIETPGCSCRIHQPLMTWPTLLIYFIIKFCPSATASIITIID